MKPTIQFALLAILFIIGVQGNYWALILLAALIAIPTVRHIRMKRYFASPEFLAHKEALVSVVSEHNELAGYIDEIRERGTFTLGQTQTGQFAHLADSRNTSYFAYKRDRHVANYASKYVHNGGLQLVRNAAAEPIKYLMKYFDIPANEEKLQEVEKFGESISRLENAAKNLSDRGNDIARSINPPAFILKHYRERFQNQVGLVIPPLDIPYQTYEFQYVSAGGNSSQVTRVKLDAITTDALIQTMAEKIKFKKSAAGQRSIMTSRFREYIKKRDSYTCVMCKVSQDDEAHLLLEVEHIPPISKGGLSVEENLQTLCWKCNRSKSNKFDDSLF